jgi:hypothetical protein
MEQHGGKELSYLNLFDGDAAWRLVHELSRDAGQPAVAIIKHANPCGAAVADSLVTAYERALECDVQSAFGGIVVAIGGVVTEEVADAIAAGAAGRRHHRRLLRAGRAGEADQPPQGHPAPVGPGSRAGRAPAAQPGLERAGAGHRRLRLAPRRLAGGDRPRQPTEEEWRDLVLAWRVCGRTTSNAIAIVNNGQASGWAPASSPGSVAAEIAVAKAGERAKGGAGASDAFFPFPDGLLVLADAGVTAVVQPGGSVKDDEVIAAADEAGPGHGGHRRTALPALMAAIVLDGEAVAARIRAEVADRVERLRGRGDQRRPGHGAGRRRRSERPLRGHEARGLRRGRAWLGGRAPARHGHPGRGRGGDRRFNADPAVTPTWCRCPCPEGLDEERALLAVDPAKDVDGLHPVNLGRLVMGRRARCPARRPASWSCWHAYDVPVEGRHVVIIGRGLTIGRPLSSCWP